MTRGMNSLMEKNAVIIIDLPLKVVPVSELVSGRG